MKMAHMIKPISKNGLRMVCRKEVIGVCLNKGIIIESTQSPYTWDMIINYIENCTEFCVQEIEERKNNSTRSDPISFYVTS